MNQPINERKLRIVELLLILGIAFLPSLIESLNFVITGQITTYSKIGPSEYIIWIAQAVLSIALLFYVLFKNNQSYSTIGLSLKFSGRDLLIGIALMFSAGLANAFFATVINMISPDFVKGATNPQNIDFIKTNYYGWLFIIMLVIPIQEELIVRGFTMTEIFNLTNSKILAIIISVAIQFTYHLYQGIAPAVFMLPYFIIISIYFIRTGNLNPVIYSHILIDLLSLYWKR